MNNWTLLIFLGVLAVSPTNSQDSSFWNLGTVPYLGGCVVNGIAIPGIKDPWPLNLHCNTYNGSVGCFKDNPNALYGLCRCNQRESAEPDAAFGVGMELCLGKVEATNSDAAYCTVAHQSFFPDKLCTPNAYCKPLQEGPGRSVGKCECLYGYDASDGKCVRNSVPDPEISTIPPITTTKAPPKEEFKLPPLDLLIKINVVPLEEQCNPNALLNKTFCNTFGRTASCLSKKCQCNMQEDAVYDEELEMCVGKQGTYCLGRKNALGFKACTKNAICVMEDGRDSNEYSFGICECEDGYDPDDDTGLCVRNDSTTTEGTGETDDDYEDGSSEGTTEGMGTTEEEDGGSKTTTPPGNNNDSSGSLNSVSFIVMIISMTCYILYF